MATPLLTPDLDADQPSSFSSASPSPNAHTATKSSHSMKVQNQPPHRSGESERDQNALHTPATTAEELKRPFDQFQSDNDARAAEESAKRIKAGHQPEKDFTLPFDQEKTENALEVRVAPDSESTPLITAPSLKPPVQHPGPQLAPIRQPLQDLRPGHPNNQLPHIWDAIQFHSKEGVLKSLRELEDFIDDIRARKNAPTPLTQASDSDVSSPEQKMTKWYLTPSTENSTPAAKKRPSTRRRPIAVATATRKPSSRFITQTVKAAEAPLSVGVAALISLTEERPAKRAKTEPKQHVPSDPAKSKPKAKPKKNESVKRSRGREVHHNAKETLLARIKGFMNSRTDGLESPKSQYKMFPDAPEIPAGNKIDEKPVLKYDKDQEKANPRFGDPSGLHPKEREMAEALKITFDEYRCQKRRILLGFALFHKLIENRTDISPSWSKTQTQAIGNVDVNKLSNLFLNFEQWGWLDRNLFDRAYLEDIKAKFDTFEAGKPKGAAATNGETQAE